MSKLKAKNNFSFLSILFVFVAIGFMAWVRLRASMTELWLDEVMSLEIARRVKFLSDVLLQRIDNNHLLNTVFLVLLGDGKPDWLYRLPSTLCSMLMLVAAYRIGYAQSALMKCKPVHRRLGGWVLIILLGFSYPVVLLGTEARGYSILMLSCMGAWWSIVRFFESKNPKWALAYGFFGSIALLAHATALFLLLGFGILQLWIAVSERRVWRNIAFKLWQWHKLTASTTMLFVLFFLPGMSIAGGEPWSFYKLLSGIFGLLGGTSNTLGLWIVFPLSIVLGCYGLYLLRRYSLRLFWLYLLCILGVPVLLLCSTQPEYLSFRYFAVSFLLFICLLAVALTHMLQVGGWRRGFAIALFGFYLVGNLGHLMQLGTYGRGACLPLIHKVLSDHRLRFGASSERSVSLAFDHKVRTQKVLHYYLNQLGRSYRVKLFYMYDQSSAKVEWLVMHELGQSTKDRLYWHYGESYRRVMVTRSARGNGMFWILYKRSQP